MKYEEKRPAQPSWKNVEEGSRNSRYQARAEESCFVCVGSHELGMRLGRIISHPKVQLEEQLGGQPQDGKLNHDNDMPKHKV